MAKLAYDLLRALEALAKSWPDVIVTREGRKLRKSAVRAVLMALHRRCHWMTAVIAIPDRYGIARPATAIDIAGEVAKHPRTVEYVMRWLMNEQRILVKLRGHGWTGATVRRFNLKRIAQLVASIEPEVSTMLTFHSERLPKANEPEVSRLLNLSVHNQEEEKARDTATFGDISHQVTDEDREEATGLRGTPAPNDSTPGSVEGDVGPGDEVPREAVEQVLHLLPKSRKETASVLMPSLDCLWSVEDNVVVVDFPKYDFFYERVQSILAELTDAVHEVLGMEVQLRLRGKRQEQQR